jgi:hypothetical protein
MIKMMSKKTSKSCVQGIEAVLKPSLLIIDLLLLL